MSGREEVCGKDAGEVSFSGRREICRRQSMGEDLARRRNLSMRIVKIDAIDIIVHFARFESSRADCFPKRDVRLQDALLQER